MLPNGIGFRIVEIFQYNGVIHFNIMNDLMMQTDILMPGEDEIRCHLAASPSNMVLLIEIKSSFIVPYMIQQQLVVFHINGSLGMPKAK